jgi:hypothetical protein
VTGEVEQTLADRGLVIEEYARFADDAEVGAVGFIGLVPASPGVRAVAYVAPRIGPEQRDRFASWVERRVDNFLECGPMRDCWEKRASDDGWQLWAHAEDLELAEADVLPEGHPHV